MNNAMKMAMLSRGRQGVVWSTAGIAQQPEGAARGACAHADRVPGACPEAAGGQYGREEGRSRYRDEDDEDEYSFKIKGKFGMHDKLHNIRIIADSFPLAGSDVIILNPVPCQLRIGLGRAHPILGQGLGIVAVEHVADPSTIGLFQLACY